MSIGSVLIGISVLAVLAAYLARPFRATAPGDPDRAIEAWVARIGDQGYDVTDRPPRTQASETMQPEEGASVDRVLNFCPQCGRRVDRHDRFCSGCGARLRRDGT